MTKRFFLAVLTAVALTMGFTACSEDDENERFAGNYKLSGFVGIEAHDIDDTEYGHILVTYRTALGITEGEDFTINGKDSADCVSNIQKCCKDAEAELAGQNWSGVYSVSVLCEDGKTNFYTHEYGRSGDNSTDFLYYPFITLVEDYCDKSIGSENWKSVKTKEIEDDTFVSGFFTQYVKDNRCCPSYLGWPLTTYHCLQNVAKSINHEIFVAASKPYYTLDNVKEMVKNNDPKLNNLVGDVKVLYFYHGDHPQDFYYKGAKYELCAGNNGTESPNDLNYKSGGPYMHLYVSHDVKHFGRVLNAKWSMIVYRYSVNFLFEDTEGPSPETSELVQGIYMDDNGNMSDHPEDGIDLELGTAASDFIKMRVGYLPLAQLGDDLEAVDLGLSTGTKWANKNVGAYITEDYGSYFAWGETVPYGKEDTSNAQNYSSTGSYNKLRLDWSTYKWCNGTSVVSKYNQDDYMTVLEPDDDAATANLGAHWRMPYKSELRELIDGCDWTWTTQKGVAGYLVKSKTNGNSIFLPAAGYCSKNDLLGEEDYVYLWSANCDFDVPYRAYYMSRSTKGYSINTEQRCLGLPIRAVYVE